MNACRTRQLGQTADCILHLARSHHHQIRKLVHDDDDLRHLFRLVCVINILNRLNLCIVAF